MTDIDTIRSAGNWSEAYVLVDEPPAVFEALATGTIIQEDWSVSYDNGSGSLAGCLPDMTLLIGSSAGAGDKGAARLRKAPDDLGGGLGVFYLGADPALAIEFGDYLTVIDDFEPFAKHPVDTLMDVDVTYSDQFTDFDPVPWFNGRCAVIAAGGTALFDASRCWVPGSTISGLSWTFTGADSYTGETTATPTATYDTSGRYRVKLTVTAANGKSFSGYGYVFVLGENLAGESNHLADEVEVDYMAGGSATVELLDRPAIRDGARAIIYTRDWYNAVEQSFGPVAGRENILLEGRIIGETIKRNPMQDTVEFEIGGPVAILERLATLPAGLVDRTLPTDEGQEDLPDWSVMDDMTVTKGLHYLAHLRSTITRCMDIDVEDWDWPIHKLTSDAETLFSQLTAYAERAALSVRADRSGRIFVERDTQLYPISYRTANIPVAMTLVDGDWLDELTIVRRQRGEVGMATAEGTIFSGGKLTQVGGRAPGDQPAHWGVQEGLSELSVSGAVDVTMLAGLMAGAKNAEIERITARLAYNNRLMDTAPRMFVNVTVDGETLRCAVRNMRMKLYSEATGFWNVELDLEPEGGEWPSVVIKYPGEGEPPVTPPTKPPVDPPIDPGEPPPPPEPDGDTDAVVCVAADVRTSDDLDAGTPTWSSEL